MFEVFCCVQSVFIGTIPSHPCFAALLFDTFFTIFSTFFSTFAFGSSASLSLLNPSMSPSIASLRLVRLVEESYLTGFEPKSLIRVSSDTHIPIVSYLRRGSLDANVDEFATILGASEACDKSNVGQLISPLFSQKREVSVIPRRIQAGKSQARCWAVFRLRETVVERYKKSRFRECAGFPNGKAKDVVRTMKYSRLLCKKSWSCLWRRMSGSDKVIWSAIWNEQKRNENANVDIVLYAIGKQFQSQRVEFFQVDHCLIRFERERSWLWIDEKQSFPEKSCKKLSRIWSITKNSLYRNWKSSTIEEWEKFLRRRKKVNVTVIRFRNRKTRWILWNMRKFFGILRLQPALVYPTSQSFYEYSESKRND